MRYSFGTIRLGTILVVSAVVLLPIAFIYLTPPYEEALKAQMQRSVTLAVEDVADGRDLAEVARAREVRLRVSSDGEVRSDIDHTHERRLTNRLATFFVSAEEELAFDTFDERLPPLAKREPVRLARSGGTSVGCGETSDEVAIYCWAAARADGEVVHAQVGALRTVSTLWDTRRQVGALLLQVLGVALVLAWWFGRRTAKPLTRLRDQVLEISEQPDTGRRVAEDGANEVVDVARAFNGLLDTLEERRAANLAFMADVGHELKGPVATALAVSEKLEADDDDQRAQRLHRALRSSSVRMKALLDDFLELARAEAGLPNVDRIDIGLAPIVAGVVDRALDDPANEGMSIETDLREVHVKGSEFHLEMLVRNLIDNALSFGKSKVVVQLVERAGEVVLVVEDDGPGVPADDRPHIFERFYTQREASSEGTGLGLAMSKAVVEAHDGSIRLEAADGARFVVRLPALSV